MADWVHCNQCFRQPGDGRKFKLTNCGHTFCQTCIDSGGKDQCSLCKSPCTTILLTSKMKPEVEKFFCDPMDFEKRHQNEMTQVMNFQKSHRQRLASYHRQLIAQQSERLQQIDTENQRLRAENAYLKKMIGSMGGGQFARVPASPVGRVHGGMVLSQRAQGNSPCQRNSPSQRSQSARSPYSQECKRVSPQDSSQHNKRVSVRPPPSQGKIGVISRTPSPSTGRTPSPSMGHASRTPGSREAGMPHSRVHHSPMKTSPSVHYRAPSTGVTPHVPIGKSRKSPGNSLEIFKNTPGSTPSQNSLSRRIQLMSGGGSITSTT